MQQWRALDVAGPYQRSVPCVFVVGPGGQAGIQKLCNSGGGSNSHDSVRGVSHHFFVPRQVVRPQMVYGLFRLDGISHC